MYIKFYSDIKETNMVKKLLLPLFILILCSGLFLTGKGLYIPIKAYIAQVLLEDSWNKIIKGEKNLKPWPWADFRPVASLLFINRKQLIKIVLYHGNHNQQREDYFRL